jgi:hypothetical protein
VIGREPYRPRVAFDVDLPALQATRLDGGNHGCQAFVLVGTFDPLGYRELEIWRRLLEQEFGAHEAAVQAFFRRGWTPKDVALIESLVPASRHGRTLVATDEADAWRTIVTPDRAERSFAAAIQAGQATVLMVGPPTEEAWDLFRSHAKPILST